MYKSTITAVMAAALLVGCASTDEGGFSQERVRQDRYLVTEQKLPARFPDIQQSLFKHRDACNIYFEFRPDPQQVHYATLLYRLNENDDIRESVFADMTAYASGNVQIDVYSYYSRNKDLAYALVDALSSPDKCPRQEQ